MINARLALLLSLIVSHASIASAVDVVIFDNLNNLSSGAYTAHTSLWQAQKFKTGNQLYSLSSVTLSLRREFGTGAAIVQIYSNTGSNVPGSSLYTLTSPGSYSGTLAPTTFTATAPGFNLAANSDYWVVLKSAAGDSAFSWSWTEDTNGTGSGFTSVWSETSDSGVTWPAGGDLEPYQMLVTVQPVPEPSSFMLAGLCVMVVGFAAKRRKKSAF